MWDIASTCFRACTPVPSTARSPASALSEAGDFLIPRREAAVDDDHIRGELGELLLGSCRGRTSESDITVFKSLGLAVEDVAAARLIYDNALAAGAGTRVELGGARDVGA